MSGQRQKRNVPEVEGVKDPKKDLICGSPTSKTSTRYFSPSFVVPLSLPPAARRSVEIANCKLNNVPSNES